MSYSLITRKHRLALAAAFVALTAGCGGAAADDDALAEAPHQIEEAANSVADAPISAQIGAKPGSSGTINVVDANTIAEVGLIVDAHADAMREQNIAHGFVDAINQGSLPPTSPSGDEARNTPSRWAKDRFRGGHLHRRPTAMLR